MRGLVVFDGLRELGFHVGVDSFENVLVAGDGSVCIPYLRENGDGVGEGGGSGSRGGGRGRGSGNGGGGGSGNGGCERHLIV